MNAKSLKAQALPVLLAGTARQPLTLSSNLAALAQGDAATVPLKALSLTGQALRFARPHVPPSFTIETIVQDLRPILTDSMRRPLLRLLNGVRPSDDIALALAWAFARGKVRPHPFDLPKMEPFVRAHAEHLGQTAQHWAQQRDNASIAPQGFLDAEELDDTTWMKATPARRARFVVERRAQDARVARSLVELVWAKESAELRLRLLMALETSLSAEDTTFLEGLSKDRAPRVRTLAHRFLSRISGHRSEHPALTACLERIRRSTSGLLKKRPVLTLELPATMKEATAKVWLRETFAEVGCEELADALQLTTTAMMDAAEKDADLLLAFALMATQDRRLDLLEHIVIGRLPGAWEQLSECGAMDLGMMETEERLRWARILVRSCDGKPPEAYSAWSWLHRSLEGPAPEELAELVLRSHAWLRKLEQESKLLAAWVELFAVLCDARHRTRLRAYMASLDATSTVRALPLLDILDSLEKAGHK